MRRRITLYIGDQRADLSDDGLVLFNYRAEDLSKPTVVSNSYSKQVTLPGTPANNAIFGHIFRTDRITDPRRGVTGPGFDPSARTPFSIYAETGEVLESGYVRLDGATRSGRGTVSYKCTLFGGLGSFFYGLAYDADGNRLSLADLDYGKDLGFTITAADVQAAWTALLGGGDGSKWDIINFAPCYEGIPDGDFDAGKAIATVASVGLTDNVSKDGKTYSSRSGKTLVTFADKHTALEAKDLRCYLQRPVLSWDALLDAVERRAAAIGYSFNAASFHGSGLWMTLPLIPSLGTYRQQEVAVPMSYTSAAAGVLGPVVGTLTPDTLPASGTKVTATLNLQRILMQVDTSVFAEALAFDRNSYHSGIFAQLVAYDSLGTAIAGGPVKLISNVPTPVTPRMVAQACSYTPVGGDDATYLPTCTRPTNASKYTGGIFIVQGPFSLTCEATDAAEFRLEVKGCAFSWSYQVTPLTAANDLTDVLLFYTSGGSFASTAILGLQETTAAGTGSGITSTTVRSGAHITKRMLLSTSGTPADYLLAYAKTFGYYFLVDDAQRKVTMLRREDFYNGREIDITERIDTSRDVEIVPLTYSARWYDFAPTIVQGEFAAQYKAASGMDYGIQRVNTGYAFDASSVNLMGDTILRAAVTSLERSPYFATVLSGGGAVPSLFLAAGNTYTLWASDGSSAAFDVPQPAGVVTTPLNAAFPGYDVPGGVKLQLHDASGKPLDGGNVLCMMTGSVTYPYFKVSDDDPATATLNGGKPCWNIDPGTAAGVTVPVFSRYAFGVDGVTVERSLDFGIPSEVDVPGMIYTGGTVYLERWRDYLADRYDIDTKVMRCRMHMGGLPSGQEVLRPFYWYAGSLWALNSVKNYSLTTFDPAECEFVQIRDKNNYTA